MNSNTNTNSNTNNNNNNTNTNGSTSTTTSTNTNTNTKCDDKTCSDKTCNKTCDVKCNDKDCPNKVCDGKKCDKVCHDMKCHDKQCDKCKNDKCRAICNTNSCNKPCNQTCSDCGCIELLMDDERIKKISTDKYEVAIPSKLEDSNLTIDQTDNIITIEYKKEEKTETEQSKAEGIYSFTIDSNRRVKSINREGDKLSIDLEEGKPEKKTLKIEHK